MLEMYHDCDRLFGLTLCMLIFAVVLFATYWPQLKRNIERKRRAKKQ